MFFHRRLRLAVFLFALEVLFIKNFTILYRDVGGLAHHQRTSLAFCT